MSSTDQQRLTGVRGWLALFVFGWLVGGPAVLILAFASLVPELGDWSAADALRAGGPLTGMALTSVVGAYAGWLLLFRRSTGPQVARLALVSSVFYFVALSVAMGLLLGAVEAGRALGQGLGGLIGMLFWWQYFDKSKRVAATFGVGAARTRPPVSHVVGVLAAVLLVTVGPVVVVSLSWPSSQGTWMRFSPEGGQFAALLPGEPTVSYESDADDPSVLITSAMVETSDGAAFLIAYFDFPSHYDLDEGAILGRAMDDRMAALNLQKGRRTLVEANGFYGVGSSGTSDSLALDGKVRLFLVGRRLYTVIALSPSPQSSVHSSAAQKFLASFAPYPE
ncbi:MAG: hypothetical protein ABS36_05130 [Acidobacteria bacterium SCN 69-37]|nr:MAG: hypothetical protein ABS36_05130 [Acidobacteria bacterium SCN 69-37]